MVGSLEIGMVILNLAHKNIATPIQFLVRGGRGGGHTLNARITNLSLIEDEECRLSV